MTLAITSSFQIPDNDLVYRFARSGGPGGQNVNKLNTKVVLDFDLAHAACVPDNVREKLLIRLANRLTSAGVLQLTAQTHRTQLANREAVTERLVQVLQAALREAKPRKATKPTRSSQERRLESKKRDSRTKQRRQLTDW